MSVVASGEVRERCEELGANGYLQKPFDPDELLQALDSITSPN